MLFTTYYLDDITIRVNWEVEFHKDFDPEFDVLPEEVRNELRAHALLLERFCPQPGRPRASPSRSTRDATLSFRSRKTSRAAARRDFTAGS